MMAGVFEKMAADPRMKGALKEAQAAEGTGRIDNNAFTGPDGEYFASFIRFSEFKSKKDQDIVAFDFRFLSCAGQEAVRGKKMNVFIMFEDGKNRTIEGCMEQLFVTAKYLGVDCAGGAEALPRIKKDIEDAVGKVTVKAAITSSKEAIPDGKGGKKPQYRNFFINQFVKAADVPDIIGFEEEESTDKTSTQNTYAVDVDWVATGEKAAAGDEEAMQALTVNCPDNEDPDLYTWEDLGQLIQDRQPVVAEADVEPEPEVQSGDSDEWAEETAGELPSAHIGEPVEYNNLTYWITAANDAEGTVTLCDENDVDVLTDLAYAETTAMDIIPE